MKTMNQLRVGESAQVLDILPSSSMRRRLQDVGIVNGAWVKCLHVSPFGNPVAYQLSGAVIALRNDDSAKIVVNTE